MKPIVIKSPSNIAIVKYMGKADRSLNLPANSSISLTLDRLATWLVLTKFEDERLGSSVECLDQSWLRDRRFDLDSLGLDLQTLEKLELSEKEKTRTLEFFNKARLVLAPKLEAMGFRLADSFDRKTFELRSANTFPASAGIASSAASFSAVALAAAVSCVRESDQFCREFSGVREVSTKLKLMIAEVARQGSGSSCRSLVGPWVKWEGEKSFELPSRLPQLVDLVMVVGREKKQVGSSEAHSRVLASPLWQARQDRMPALVRTVEESIRDGDLNRLAELSFKEALEMHSLFHTSAVPFTYFLPGTMKILNWVMALLADERKGFKNLPIVTLDAGPNIHFIVEDSVKEYWVTKIQEYFPEFEILVDSQGAGSKIFQLEHYVAK